MVDATQKDYDWLSQRCQLAARQRDALLAVSGMPDEYLTRIEAVIAEFKEATRVRPTVHLVRDYKEALQEGGES